MLCRVKYSGGNVIETAMTAYNGLEQVLNTILTMGKELGEI
jgi:hypothetical protein